MPSDELAQQVLHGIEMARDPRNAQARGLDDLRVTTIYSPWLLQLCRVCRHSFREQDRVRPDPLNPRRMLHDDEQAQLLCARPPDQRRAFSAAPPVDNSPIRDAFLRGLQVHWQPAGGVSTIIMAPRSEFVGRRCPICRHTVRPGDTIVPCPCGRDCGGVFHQDPLRHLTCWDTWSRGASPAHCAFTGASFRTGDEGPQ